MSLSGNVAGLIAGFVWSPKNESLIVVPPVAALVSGFEGRTPPRSDADPDTELLTAAKTTLAKEIPEVDPRYLESEAPSTDTLPMLCTRLERCFCSVSSVDTDTGPALPSVYFCAPATVTSPAVGIAGEVGDVTLNYPRFTIAIPHLLGISRLLTGSKPTHLTIGKYWHPSHFSTAHILDIGLFATRTRRQLLITAILPQTTPITRADIAKV